VKTPKNKCATCGYVADNAALLFDDNAVPEQGDVTLCMKCGELYLFDRSLHYKKPSARKLLELKASAAWLEVIRIRRALKEIQKTHPIPDR
jgi:hypothetical protein